jgi:hypothetical protein
MMKGFKHPTGGSRGGYEFQKPPGPGGFFLQGDQRSGFDPGDPVDAVPDCAGPMELPVVVGLPEQSGLAPDLGRGDSRGLQLG